MNQKQNANALYKKTMPNYIGIILTLLLIPLNSIAHPGEKENSTNFYPPDEWKKMVTVQHTNAPHDHFCVGDSIEVKENKENKIIAIRFNSSKKTNIITFDKIVNVNSETSVGNIEHITLDALESCKNPKKGYKHILSATIAKQGDKYLAIEYVYGDLDNCKWKKSKSKPENIDQDITDREKTGCKTRKAHGRGNGVGWN